MLGLSDLKQTKVYQEALEEGREEGLEQGRQQGREEGIHEGLQLAARAMLEQGMSVEQVHQLTDLPLAEIREIEQSRSQ